MKVRRTTKAVKYRLPAARSHRRGRNGHIDVVSPATAAEIRKTLGITAGQIKNVRRALQSAGVKI